LRGACATHDLGVNMAKYEHLPIYKQALDLAVYLEKTVSGFSRQNEGWIKSLQKLPEQPPRK
jgi:hypothetical protein